MTETKNMEGEEEMGMEGRRGRRRRRDRGENADGAQYSESVWIL